MLEREITAFLDRTGMAVTTFGRRAVNDPRLVLDLRNGREPGQRTVARVRTFIADHRP